MDAPIGPGDLLAGKYRIERRLGEGGMGVVFKATHVTLEKPRAIKVLHAEIAADAEAVRRFLREARATSELSSRHVACVHDVDRLPSGQPYLVMEYLDGADLASILAAHGPLPAAEAARYVREACDALAEAHARGLVHRDVKPANLFLARREGGLPAIKVLDFGIAKAAAPSAGAATAAGAFLGTLKYAAPEQIECSASVDARADLWALGVVLYELCTGALPFDSPSAVRLIALITESAPTPPSERVEGLPAGLDAILLRCLEKDRERRFASAAELAEALRSFASEGDALAGVRLSIPVTPRSSHPTATAPVLTPVSAPAPVLTSVSVPPIVAPQRRSPVAWSFAAAALGALVIAVSTRAKPSAPVAASRAPPSITSAPVAPPVASPSASPPPSPALGSASGASTLALSPDQHGSTPAAAQSASASLPRKAHGAGALSPPQSKPMSRASRYDIDGNLVSE
jgi:serine/threonine protein kinase